MHVTFLKRRGRVSRKRFRQINDSGEASRRIGRSRIRDIVSFLPVEIGYPLAAPIVTPHKDVCHEIPAGRASAVA